jgi:hypothetical protein
MHLFNGVFSKNSAFSKVNTDNSRGSVERHGGSFDLTNNLHSSASNPSLEDKRELRFSSERGSSSSERDLSMNSEKPGSLDRVKFNTGSPLLPQGQTFFKPKAIKPTTGSNFGFLSN